MRKGGGEFVVRHRKLVDTRWQPPRYPLERERGDGTRPGNAGYGLQSIEEPLIQLG